MSGKKGPSRPDADAEKVRRCPIVGLGASAGGLEALSAFLGACPEDTGLAFVIVQHLDPTHESMMAGLLARYTAMKVSEAVPHSAPEANHIYLNAPSKNLLLKGGLLELVEPEGALGHRAPIDAFFRSLAEEQGENAAGVILSGAGSDGALGLRAIKETGGLTLVQSCESAKFDSMPRSAEAVGDMVLVPEAMPPILADYFRHIVAGGDGGGGDGTVPDLADQLVRICAVLQTRTGHDFSRYKKNTLIRRIQRRMQVLKVGEASQYIDVLRKSDDEAKQLFRDLLINVTQFFRDQEAFALLARQVIPRLVDGRGQDDPIRLWVPGCSTGEEPYSLAILLSERAREIGAAVQVQIFASDIDEDALELARLGRYPLSIDEDVSAERLARYFTRTDSGYTINKDIRESCIFSVHSVIKDPPFSRIDLISCRNLLIYLGSQLQARLVPLFHYALKPQGILFLGPSENISQHSQLFSAIDATARIFCRRDVPRVRDLQFPLGNPVSSAQAEGRVAPRRTVERDREQQDRLVERLILDSYAPAFAVVNENGDIVQSSTRTGTYLELPGGTPNLNIVDMARPTIRNDIRVALRRSVRESRRIVQANLECATDGGSRRMDLIVHPLPGSGHYLVVFQDIAALRAERAADSAPAGETAGNDGRVQELEATLQLTREKLRTTIEELETSNEELKSSNEEMVSMNEELQSTNEELESSKEELQSINEELETVNAELRHKVLDLSRANSDLQNLFESPQIATIFLGNDLRIKNFTPPAKQIFSLIDSDRGRPLVDLASKLPLSGLQEAAAGVVRTLMPLEREVSDDADGQNLLMRIVPYRTVDNVIEGVVVTFIDVTRLKQAEHRLAESEARYRALLQGAHDAALVFALEGGDRPGPIQEANEATRRLLGYGDDEVRRLRLEDIVASRADDVFAWIRNLTASRTIVTERDYRAKDGTLIPVEESAALVEFGKQSLVVILARDIRERREHQRRQDMLMRELQHRVKNTMAQVGAIVTHTGQATGDFETFKALLEGRLRALAATHSRLTESNWRALPLRLLVGDMLRVFTGSEDRMEVAGEDVLVAPKAALTLGMALHELATNAVKFGALSTPRGKVQLRWGRTRWPADALELVWAESDGPEITQPPRRGFGRFFLEKGVGHELDATVDLTFERQGLRCVIRIPQENVVETVTAGDAGT